MSTTNMHGPARRDLRPRVWSRGFAKFLLAVAPLALAAGSAAADDPAWYVGQYYNPTNPASPTGFTTGYQLYRTIGCPGKELLGVPCPVPTHPVAAGQANPASAAAPGASAETASAETEAQKRARIVELLARNSVYFDFDKAVIKPEYLDTIKKNYEALQALPSGAPLRLEGNCDERGSAEYNLALGQRRADAVRRALVALGFPEAQIDTVSWGKGKPRCTEHDEQCWSQNRRVDFIAK